MSERNSFRLPPGGYFKLKQLSDKTWSWEITQWKRSLAAGHAGTRSEAEKELKQAAGQVLLKAAVKSADRSALRQKLKGWVKNRPYLAAFVLEALEHGLPSTEITMSARAEEEGRHANAEGVLGWEPLSKHPARKTAEEGAMVIIDCVGKLGWDSKRIGKWARDYMGGFYSNPDGTLVIEVQGLPKKMKAPDENEGEDDAT
jgi:hypothetical protein